MARTKKDVTVKHRVKRVLSSLRLLRGFDRRAESTLAAATNVCSAASTGQHTSRPAELRSTGGASRTSGPISARNATSGPAALASRRIE